MFLEVPVTPLITESDCSGPRRGTVLVLAAGGSHVGAVVTAPVVDETESKDKAGNGQHCADDSVGASIFLGSSNAREVRMNPIPSQVELRCSEECWESRLEGV